MIIVSAVFQMGRGSVGAMARLAAATTEQISIISLTSLLGLTGISILIWMSAAGWTDINGCIVGAVFLLVTLLQMGFATMWWRAQSRTSQEYPVQVSGRQCFFIC